MFYAGFDLLFSILFPILFLVALGMILYTIQVESGDRMELTVDGADYGMLVEDEMMSNGEYGYLGKGDTGDMLPVGIFQTCL